MSLAKIIRGIYVIAVLNFGLAIFTYLVIIVTKQFGLSYVNWSWYHWWLFVGVLMLIVGIFFYMVPYWEAKLNIKLQKKLQRIKETQKQPEVK